MEPVNPAPRRTFTSYWKAVAAFLTTLGAFIVGALADPDIAAVLTGSGVEGWLVTVGVPAIVGAATAIKRNEPTVEEAEAMLVRARNRAVAGK